MIDKNLKLLKFFAGSSVFTGSLKERPLQQLISLTNIIKPLLYAYNLLYSHLFIDLNILVQSLWRLTTQLYQQNSFCLRIFVLYVFRIKINGIVNPTGNSNLKFSSLFHSNLYLMLKVFPNQRHYFQQSGVNCYKFVLPFKLESMCAK